MNDMPLAASAVINDSQTLVNTRIGATELQMHPVKSGLSIVSSNSTKHMTVESYTREVADISACADGGVPVRVNVKKNEYDDFVLVQRKKKRPTSKFVGLPGRAQEVLLVRNLSQVISRFLCL